MIPTTIIQGFENRHKIIASRSERHTVFWITRNLDEEWRFGEGHIVGLLRCDAVTSGYDVHEFRHPVQVVPADDFDPYMLEMLDRVAHAADTDGFVKAARVVGAAVGHCEQDIGDAWFEYRLREFIYAGILEVRGIPAGLRHYSVRRKKPLTFSARPC